MKAPEIPGIAQKAAIHFAFLISETDLIAMYLISKCGWPKYPNPQLIPPRATETAPRPDKPAKTELRSKSLNLNNSDKLWSNDKSSKTPTSGKITKVPIINIPWIKSVHATANKPPKIVYIIIMIALRVIPYNGSIPKIVFKIFPDPWNCAET